LATDVAVRIKTLDGSAWCFSALDCRSGSNGWPSLRVRSSVRTAASSGAAAAWRRSIILMLSIAPIELEMSNFVAALSHGFSSEKALLKAQATLRSRSSSSPPISREDVMRRIYCLFLVFCMALTRSSSAMSFPSPIVGVLLFLTFLVVKATLRFLRKRWASQHALHT
jgi:hypothetical protein